MAETDFRVVGFDSSDPFSIYEYSRFLIGESLHSLLGDTAVAALRRGKGGLGQMVEELFFNYQVNSKREADFTKAGLELKCTPLLESGQTYRIKERLVCTMIDYAELADTEFEDSHLLTKCRLMLLLFYLHRSGIDIYDYKFLYRILWQLPEKDLIQIRNDYNTIAEKVRRGEAHLISEGDTLYLGACRKGQKGDTPQNQPFSKEKAYKRAFSLKPAYMRHILSHAINDGGDSYTNYVVNPSKDDYELVSKEELKNETFENLILKRFDAFKGLNYLEICSKLGVKPYQAKNKYADICGLIASNGQSKRLSDSEEFQKSGIVMKTVRLRKNGSPKEAMSFKNIDYDEIMENQEWLESEVYEIFTNRFLFVVFKPMDSTLKVFNNSTGRSVTEQTYVLESAFFWTMPPTELLKARDYWSHIRKQVIANKINLNSFWSIADDKDFHVRPKASNGLQFTKNPHGGKAPKYCYWFNASYVKKILDSNV